MAGVCSPTEEKYPQADVFLAEREASCWTRWLSEVFNLCGNVALLQAPGCVYLEELSLESDSGRMFHREL